MRSRRSVVIELGKLTSTLLFKQILLLIILLLVYFGYDYLSYNRNHISELEKKVASLEEKLGSAEASQCNGKVTIRDLSESIVRVVGGEGEGSGFMTPDGYIITNFHVIEFEPSPKVIFPDNTFEKAEIVAASKDSDLAYLRVEKKLPGIKWANLDSIEQGDEVLAMGFPFGGEISGGPTVTRGIISGRQKMREHGVEYIHSDVSINPGVSGGPMVTSCGEVIGVNTSSLGGLGFAISNTSVQLVKKQLEVVGLDPLKDIEVLELQPGKSPLDAVNSFYSYLKLRRMKEAYGLLSADYINNISYTFWKEGYYSLLDTTVILSSVDVGNANKINVKLSTKDFVKGEILYKYFEGYWIVKEENGKYSLREPKIKEIKEPEYDWFWE